MLSGVIEVLKTFLVNLKDTVPISAKSSIKFVRKGAKVIRKRTPPVGILHHASQWILLADLDKNCWCVKLSAVEVGARAYCSKYVLCCFKKLGFSNPLISNTTKKLSKSSMECSFCIWLARNNNCNLNDPSKETCNSQFSLSSLKQTIKPVSNTKWTHPVAFINKGNTCYANSIFQVLSVVPNIWNRVPSKSNTLSPMLQAISLNVAVKKNSTKPVDPPNFLSALKRKLSIIRGVPFDFNTQRDVAEILLVVLDELIEI